VTTLRKRFVPGPKPGKSPHDKPGHFVKRARIDLRTVNDPGKKFALAFAKVKANKLRGRLITQRKGENNIQLGIFADMAQENLQRLPVFGNRAKNFLELLNFSTIEVKNRLEHKAFGPENAIPIPRIRHLASSLGRNDFGAHIQRGFLLYDPS
jgi:hypothetical protein